jgi:hypothetical protein
MTPAMEAYDEVDGVEGFDDFESVRDHRSQPRMGVAPGGFALQGFRTARLDTPKGVATLTMPQAMATATDVQGLYRSLQADLARVRKLALRPSDPQGLNMMSLFLLMKLKKDLEEHTHDSGPKPTFDSASTGGFSSFLPLLMLQPGLFGGVSGFSSTQSSTTQDAMSPLMLMILMDLFD